MVESRRWRTQAQRLTSENARPATHRILLVLYCLLLYLPAMFRGFINFDETRYAEIVREMLENGDWIVPHLNYVPYFMKPPLVYWLAAGLAKAFGFHPFAMRLAPFLAAILTVLATYELATALGSRRTGLVGAALLATCGLFYILAVALVTDMIFSAFLVGAWLCFWRFYESAAQKKRWIALFWLCAALSCLTKGPLGLALLFFTIGCFVALRREWSYALKVRPLLGLVILAAVNLPWIILIGRRDPRFVEFFYVQISLAGVHSAALMHKEPFYYYLTQFPLGLFPWTLPAIVALLVSIRDFLRQRRNVAPAGLVFLVSVFLGGLVFLSIPAAKLVTYILPIFPAAALLAAHSLRQVRNETPWVRWLVPAQTGVLLASLLVGLLFFEEGPHVSAVVSSPAFPMAVAVATFAVLGAVLASVISLRGGFHAGLLALGITVSLAFPSGLILLPRLATWRTSERLCASFRNELAAADLVVTSDSDDFSVPLALRRRVAVVGQANELGMGLFVKGEPDRPIPDDPFHLKARHLTSPYLLSADGLARVWATTPTVCLFTNDKFLPDLQARCPNVWVLSRTADTILATNRNPHSRSGSAQ